MTLGGMFGAMMDGPAEPVAPKLIIKGLGISTVDTPDMGYETAILDAHGTHPVERYDSRVDAIVGHLHWAERALTGCTHIVKIGYGDLVADRQLELAPCPSLKLTEDGLFDR